MCHVRKVVNTPLPPSNKLVFKIFVLNVFIYTRVIYIFTYRSLTQGKAGRK